MRTPAILRPPSHGEEGREAPGMFFEPFNTEQLYASARLRLGYVINCNRTAHPTPMIPVPRQPRFTCDDRFAAPVDSN